MNVKKLSKRRYQKQFSCSEWYSSSFPYHAAFATLYQTHVEWHWSTFVWRKTKSCNQMRFTKQYIFETKLQFSWVSHILSYEAMSWGSTHWKSRGRVVYRQLTINVTLFDWIWAAKWDKWDNLSGNIFVMWSVLNTNRMLQVQESCNRPKEHSHYLIWLWIICPSKSEGMVSVPLFSVEREVSLKEIITLTIYLVNRRWRRITYFKYYRSLSSHIILLTN